MAIHKNNVYSINPRLNAHDAQLLDLGKEIESVVLSPGPQGKQGQTGASGADGKNGRNRSDGKDSTIAEQCNRQGAQDQRSKVIAANVESANLPEKMASRSKARAAERVTPARKVRAAMC